MRTMTEEETKLNKEFLDKGKEFWEYQDKIGVKGAVKYVINNETGETAIFTRGEYRSELIQFIENLDNHYFN